MLNGTSCSINTTLLIQNKWIETKSKKAKEIKMCVVVLFWAEVAVNSEHGT